MPKPVRLVGLHVSEARKRLDAAGWEELGGSTWGFWIVCSQWPSEAESATAKATNGKYYMSLEAGPNCRPVTMPKLVGRTAAEAEWWANSLGLVLDIELKGSGQQWVVCRQGPKAGTVIDRSDPHNYVWAFAEPPGRC